MEPSYGEIEVPRMKMEFQANLREALKDIGDEEDDYCNSDDGVGAETKDDSFAFRDPQAVLRQLQQRLLSPNGGVAAVLAGHSAAQGRPQGGHL